MGNTKPQQEPITTQRFDLRPLRISDKGLLELYAGDKRVAHMSPWIPHPLPPGAIDAFIKRAMTQDHEEYYWVIDGHKSGGAELMGVISHQPLDRNQSEVAYWIAPPYWNTGLASEALQTLIDANPLQSEAIFGSVFQENLSSAKVLTHCGFSYLGDAETFCVSRHKTVPTWTYTLKLSSAEA